MTRHSHQDALDDQTYNQLLDATSQLPEPRDREAEFIVATGGRLGLRAGEITHMNESWIDWTRSLITIPRYEPCQCGYCRKRAEAHAAAEDVPLEDAIDNRWNPKTEASVRTIPFDFDPQVAEILERFFWHRTEYPKSRVSINRRVTEAAEAAGLTPDDVYPHALRATAASHHAYRGVPLPALQSLMGWSRPETAQKYIRLSGGQTARALRDAHGGSAS